MPKPKKPKNPTNTRQGAAAENVNPQKPATAVRGGKLPKMATPTKPERKAWDPAAVSGAERVTNEVTVEEVMSGAESSLRLKRLAKQAAWENGSAPEETVHTVHQGDARDMLGGLGPVHLVVTSPPYFNLIDYDGDQPTEGQLGSIDEYEAFLDELDRVWQRCYDVLTLGGRMCVVVGSVCISRRAGGRHHVLPLPADISVRARQVGFDYLTPIQWYKIANMATEAKGVGFLGKPYEPNAIIKNDIEMILMLRKPGGYRKPTPAQRALSLIELQDHQQLVPLDLA